MLEVKLQLTNILQHFFIRSFRKTAPLAHRLVVKLFSLIAVLLVHLRCRLIFAMTQRHESLDCKRNAVKVEYPVVEEVVKSRHMVHQGILGEMNLFPFIMHNWYQPQVAAPGQYFYTTYPSLSYSPPTTIQLRCLCTHRTTRSFSKTYIITLLTSVNPHSIHPESTSHTE